MLTKKYVTTLIFIVFLSLFITGCKESLDEKFILYKGNDIKTSKNIHRILEKSKIKSAALTKEWIMDYYSLREEDVQGYDIDLMIKHGFLADQEKTIRRYPSKEDFLESLPWLHEKSYETEYANELKELNDYTYLLEGEDKFPKSYNQIKYLGIESIWDDRQPNETDPTGKVSVLFDFEKKKAFYKHTGESVLHDIRRADQVVDLTDEELKYILEQLDESDFSNWPSYQTSEYVYDNWKYGIESIEGTVFSNMIEDLPNNTLAWDLFLKIFSFSIPFPIMTK